MAKSGAGKVEEGAENAASEIANTAKRAYHKDGAELKDSVLTTKAKAELLTNEETKDFAIQVSTHIGVVTLRGKVDSKKKAEQAQEVVARIDGVKKIRHELIYSGSAPDPPHRHRPCPTLPLNRRCRQTNVAPPVH